MVYSNVHILISKCHLDWLSLDSWSIALDLLDSQRELAKSGVLSTKQVRMRAWGLQVYISAGTSSQSSAPC